MNNEWIKNLKVGDLVILSSRHSRAVKKVDKVTPTGRIKVGSFTFNADGSERGRDPWYYTSLLEATPGAVKAIKEENAIRKAIRTMRDTQAITYLQAVEILKILEVEE